MIEVVLAIAFYLYGSIPTALLVELFYKGNLSIIYKGSKNIGTLNFFRIYRDIPLTLLILLVDLSKGIFPALVFGFLARVLHNEYLILLSVVGILGHNFPILTKFKGGRGVAAYLGLILTINPMLFLVFLVSWSIFYLVTRYIFISTLLSSVVVLFVAHFYGLPTFLTVFLATILVFLKHIEKIKMFLKGKEPKSFWKI